MPTPEHPAAAGVRRIRRMWLLHKLRPSLHTWTPRTFHGKRSYEKCPCTATRPLAQPET